MSGTRWSDVQFALSADGSLRPHAHALDVSPVSPDKRAAERAAEVDPAVRGGPAAARSWAKASKRADWDGVLERVHGVGQCADCAKTPRPHRCVEHRAPAGVEGAWWHRACADSGLKALTVEAEAREAEALTAEGSGWRREWKHVRGEQLRLQGQGQAATERRLLPGRPESVEWIMSTTFEPQVGYLCREEGWVREDAVSYTLLASGGVAALARAARDGEGEFAESRRKVVSVLWP